MTANALSSDRDHCLRAGMNDFLTKPVTKQELREKVTQWVRSIETGKNDEGIHKTGTPAGVATEHPTISLPLSNRAEQ